MRQWHVPAHLLCDKHLLGEHVEHHMFAGALRAGRDLEMFITYGYVAVHTLIERHEELVTEMLARGFNHKSPMPLDLPKYLFAAGHVDTRANIIELKRRCHRCRKRIRKHLMNNTKRTRRKK